MWITHFPAVAGERERIAARGIDGDRRAKFLDRSIFAGGCHSGDRAIFLNHVSDSGLLQHFGAFSTGVIEKHLVKLAA